MTHVHDFTPLYIICFSNMVNITSRQKHSFYFFPFTWGFWGNMFFTSHVHAPGNCKFLYRMWMIGNDTFSPKFQSKISVQNLAHYLLLWSNMTNTSKLYEGTESRSGFSVQSQLAKLSLVSLLALLIHRITSSVMLCLTWNGSTFHSHNIIKAHCVSDETSSTLCLN